jgi:hypothetical protein
MVVAVFVGVYHWRVLRADAAARPAKHALEVAPEAPAATPASVPTETEAPVAATHGRRYILTVDDATDDDVHQALASLPPQASYHLTPD